MLFNTEKKPNCIVQFAGSHKTCIVASEYETYNWQCADHVSHL
jgi:hypothetical protein